MQEKIISVLSQAEELVARIKSAVEVCKQTGDVAVELTYKGVNKDVLMAAAQLIVADGIVNLPKKALFTKDFNNVSVIVRELI